ncbi:MAG: hypothetical protein WC464_00180 [Bdellovibrionales bacterium]|jgi:hypothetical protein
MENNEYPKCWVFDSNRRKYDDNNRSSPIWRYHWRETKIVGETSKSWITEYKEKIPKKNPKGVVFSEQELDDAEYVHNNSYKISQRVFYANDYKTLKNIEEILNKEQK